MAKKVTIDQEITSLDQPWGGTYQNGQEWGLKKERVEEFLKAKLSAHETSIAGKVAGVIVNNTEVTKDANGKVNIIVPSVTADVTNPSNANAAQAGAVATEINAINSNLIADIQLGETSQDGSMIELNFFNAAGDKLDDLTVLIPAAQEVGEIIQPVITTELLSASRIKLGDSISLRWGYDCLRKFEGVSERVNYPAQTVAVTVKIGTTTVYTETYAQVAVGTTNTLTLSPEIINQAGTVSISVVATTPIDEEIKTSRGSKSVTVITMDLATTFDPASQLALSNGYTDGQTIAIPYTYTVPTGTTLRVWVDGVLDATDSISGTGRNYVYLTASNLSAGRHNVQLIAESAGLLSNAVSVDVLKAGGTADYLGIRMKTDVSQLSSMPLPYAYGVTALPLSVAQFEELTLDIAAWNNDTLASTIFISVDGVVTQTLTADRTLQTISQRFDTAGNHTMVIALNNDNITAYRTFGVTVNAASGVTESEAVGYRTKLTATGRNNGEANPADWGGITTFTGVDWRTNGWNRGSDGVDTLLLTNGARANIDVKPFVLDASDGDYSIQNGGMTLEMEVMVSQVMQRGATVVSCLWDNGGQGYPMGIKVTTEEAGLYFGGVEEITTAEDLVDENGNYIDYQGNIVDSDHAVKLKITRPHGVSMNISPDKWLHLTFVVQPVSNGYGLAMLFINGVLSKANRYSGALRQNTPQMITVDSDKADVRIRGMRYYRTPLTADEVLANWILDRPTSAEIQAAHLNNAVGDSNNTADADGNIAINRDSLLGKGHGVITIIRSGDSGDGMTDLFTCVDKKQNFKADLVRWDPPLDALGNKIGEGFTARNVRVRIQGTSSVKYPYKNIRIYLTTEQDGTRELIVGTTDITASGKGYPLRGSGNSIEQGVICLKTDFVDSSLVLNTGGAHLFDTVMKALHLETPPQEVDARVRQAIDGIPCDIFCGTSEQGALTYRGQFVLNNEKSKSGKIFGMEGVDGFSGTEDNPLSIALEALNNSSPMTLFQPAGSANSTALANQLAAEFDNGFEFNFPEDAKWANVDEGQWDAAKNKWSVKPAAGARDAIKRWMGWIYDCVPAAMRSNPDYGTAAGWSDESKVKWVSNKFKTEASQYFNVNHLLTYYLFTDYWASVDQRAKNILWRTWDGLKWYATYYDGDTAQSIRNDAFMVYLYNVTRDTYDNERAKYAFEGHSSWLWCLVLANFEDELRTCAANLRNQLTTEKMLKEFNETMQGNWSERQYNKSGKLKYIDTIQTMNYVYTLTGNREAHRTAFLTDRARLLDARYGAGDYNGDVITFTVVRNSSDTPSSLTLKSGDLYYFGYKLNGIWLQGPSRAAQGENLTLTFTGQLATNDPLMLGGASCIKELDLTNMGSQLNGTVNLSLCTMLEKLVMPATNGVANAPITMGNISKLQYIDVTGQTAVNTGSAGEFDVSKHTRLTTLLAGGTSFTKVSLAEGAPITTLVLPSTLQTLTLRYLPNLTHSGLTLQNTASIRNLNFAECPNIDWRILLQQCGNIDHVRIEGMSGRVRSSVLRPFMSGYMGLTATGAEQTYPALIGTVQLIDVVDDFAEMQTFFERCGLTLVEAQYSEYIFDDEETDPSNITNVDNQTGYQHRVDGEEYDNAHPNGYYGSGHVKLIRDRSHIVKGEINVLTHKMHCTKISRESLNLTANGDAFNPADPNGEMYDVFMYLPKYYYKGVNDYKNARKHLYLSSRTTTPESTATITRRLTLASLLHVDGKAIDNRYFQVGDSYDATILSTAQNLNLYKVEVTGMKQVRFPGMAHSYFASFFADATEKFIEIFTFTMQDIVKNGSIVNPADFDNDLGDYIFLPVPEGAKYLYFACTKTAAATLPEVILTDSAEVEAIEPDWVEHKSELIGVYQGWASGMSGASGGIATSGLRSISGKVVIIGNGTSTTNAGWTYDTNGNPTNLPSTKLNGTAQDFFNLARYRGEGYSTVSYETSKDMANLLMAWFGTRDIETLVGRGSSAGEISGVRNSIAFGDSNYYAQNQHNKMWGLECWTASTYEWTDKGCLNAPSFTQFLKDKRPDNNGSYPIDYYYNILQQDGNERRVKAATANQATCAARVRFGRFCDIVVSSYTGETTFAMCYAAYQATNGSRGRVLGRSRSNASAYAGVAFSSTGNASSNSNTYGGGRLCFFGEIENESDLQA